ncbi:MAG: aminotransferase class I/II-fold pyridoxal phosphate-dependent enzyme [Candidatus Omnitrophota bacterium]
MSKYKISRLVEEIPPSGIRAFFDLVLGMKDVISLGVGEPDFITPWNIREAAIFSLEQGYTSYTSNKGLRELRSDIARFLNQRFGLVYDPEEEILITVGVSEAMDLAVRTIVNRGDRIILPEPCYVSYFPITHLAGGKGVFLRTKPEDGFKVTPGRLKEACSPKAKGIIFNYPANPTGASYSKNELKQLSAVFKSRDMIVISDEIYGDLTYDFDHTPLAALPGMKDRTIYLNGFSKGYAMTGWRIGYACGPKQLIQAMLKIHQYTMLCVPITSQIAAREAVRNSLKSVEHMKKEYKRRRRYVVDELNKMGLKCHMPEGAFYVFPSIKNTGISSMEFVTGLLKKEKVAMVPGTAFGPSGEGYIRISYASNFETLKEAMIRLKRFLNTL